MILHRATAAALLILLAGCGGGSTPPQAGSEPDYGAERTIEDGYITVSDGTRLRYHLERATKAPPGPVIIQYDGYDSGTGGYFSNVPELRARLTPQGYGFLGVQVRGTGCSSGEFELFDPKWSRDGAEAVEWAAKQPWSNGSVGMMGYSYPGIMQLFTAAERPPHLKAIAPLAVISDLYRDVGFPGGIYNLNFSALFTFQQEEPAPGSVEAAIEAGDSECAQNHATGRATYNSFFVDALQNPYIDSTGSALSYPARSPGSYARLIDVPVLTVRYWQDEQTGSRVAGLDEPGALLSLLDPQRTWTVLANGNHDVSGTHPYLTDLMVRFFQHYLGGAQNGWEATKHIHLLHDLAKPDFTHAWANTYDAFPARTPRALYLRAGGVLRPEPPAGDEAEDLYLYPLPSPSTDPLPYMEAGPLSGGLLWTQPQPEDGRLVYTTPAFAQDVQTLGSASVDLWLASTAEDTDLQATITEVRPDGQEVYVARGWLRASQRALDVAQSTATRPQHLYTEAAAAPLPTDEPTLVRLEVFPFAQRFRAGSALRLVIDAPTEVFTGDWGFAYTTTPAINSILHDAAHPSKLVLGLIPAIPAVAPPPVECGLLANQPCRDSIADVPGGSIVLE